MLTTDAQTVGELVRESPLRANVFERHHIDYCCHGKRTLEEACADLGLSPDAIRAELDAAPAAGQDHDFNGMTLAELAEHIVERHHSYLRTNLPSIAQKAQRVVEAHGETHAFLKDLQRVFTGLSAELGQHMMKEEMVLFPLAAGMEEAENLGTAAPPAPCGSVQNPIRMMEHEHDDAGRALEELRRLTSNFNPPEDACNTFRALYAQLEDLERDLHMHIRLENNILFPRAANLEQRLAAR